MTENDAEARKRQWRNDLGNQPVQIGVGWTFNVQVPAANVVKRLIVLTKNDGARQTNFQDTAIPFGHATWKLSTVEYTCSKPVYFYGLEGYFSR